MWPCPRCVMTVGHDAASRSGHRHGAAHPPESSPGIPPTHGPFGDHDTIGSVGHVRLRGRSHSSCSHGPRSSTSSSSSSCASSASASWASSPIFDLALLLLAANALQPAMTGPDTSVAGGLVILATVFALNWLTAQGRERVPWLGGCWSRSRPSSPATERGWTTPCARRSSTRTTSRRHCDSTALERVEDARLVVLEQDGSVSVVPKESDATRSVVAGTRGDGCRCR